MNDARKSTGLHGDSDARGPGAATATPGVGKRTLTESAPALKATSFPSLSLRASGEGAVADSFASSGSEVTSQVGGSLPAEQQSSAADVAEAGFANGGHEIPHRKEMEQSFGMDFGHVRAHSGEAATQANGALGSQAYAMGNQVAFKTASPSPALVAHELTHVVQQTQSPSFKSDGGVDTSGEAEAEAVEAAVASGKPAQTALRSAPAGDGPGLKAIGAGPALSKRGPALDGGGSGSKFGTGMTFSLEGFEKSYDYTIWKGHHAWPIGISGVNFVVDPSVKVSGKGAAKWGGESKKDLSAQLGVFGEVGVGLSGGIPDVAEIYGTINPGIEGAFTLTKHGNAQSGAGANQGAASTWSLVGGLTLKAAVKVGVSLAGGILDQAFELGSIEICKLTGIYFDQTGFRKDKMGFEWGTKMQQLFNSIRQTLTKARNMGRAAIESARNTGHAIAQTASDFGQWVTSW